MNSHSSVSPAYRNTLHASSLRTNPGAPSSTTVASSFRVGIERSSTALLNRRANRGAPGPAFRTWVCAAANILAFAPLITHAQQPPKQQQLRIAAAADLQPVLPTLVAAYEHATGAHLTVSYGSSATLAQQLENGAPQDLFLSADYSFPERLIAARLTDETAPIPYARGTLVLWARKDSPLQPLNANSLTDPRLHKLAIANELHAPYGRAAIAALTHLHLLATLKPKLVVAENVSQTAQFADSGNAQAALISLTIASSPHFRDTGTYVGIPPITYPPVRQCAVVMKNSPNRGLAHDFLRWLTSDPIQQNLSKLGLEPAQ